jgi:hypothetical protein
MVQDVILSYHENIITHLWWHYPRFVSIITHILLNGPRDVDFGLSHVFTLDELFELLVGWADWRYLCDLLGSVAEAEVAATKEHIPVHHSPTLLAPWRMQLAHRMSRDFSFT